MFPKSIIEKLINNDVYIYIRNIDREFGGVLEEITNDDIIKLKDKYNNLIHIPLDLIDIVTERR
jgi:hypothetical protein